MHALGNGRVCDSIRGRQDRDLAAIGLQEGGHDFATPIAVVCYGHKVASFAPFIVLPDICLQRRTVNPLDCKPGTPDVRKPCACPHRKQLFPQPVDGHFKRVGGDCVAQTPARMLKRRMTNGPARSL